MIYLRTFKLSDNRINAKTIYPYNVLIGKEPDVFVFENITVLYGNNGCGKSTILNIIANKLNLKGKERNEPELGGQRPYFKNFIAECEYELGEDEYGKKLYKIPQGSRFIKSEEILYEVRKIQQDDVLRESMHAEQSRNQEMLEQNYEQIKIVDEDKIFSNIQFSQNRYSNGETTMHMLDDIIESDNLYLLDEPEVSLSPQNQVELAKKINEMARYLGVQFIIATHSPFMLGILEGKIYNLDTKYYSVQNWYDLDNIKFFQEFFEKNKRFFKE